jgi:TonB-dependent starch-binding outer membrane protein SusC
MKKHAYRQFWIKLMKFTITQSLVMIMIMGIAYAHNSKGQDYMQRRLSVKVENKNLKEVLSTIEKETDVRFVYSSQVISSNQKITLTQEDKELAVILEKIFVPLHIKYELAGRKIILSNQKVEQSPSKEVSVEAPKNLVKGKVRDDNGIELPGVSVVLKGTNTGTITDVNGVFELDVTNTSGTLVFSFVGYVSQEKVIGATTNFQ